MSLLSSAGFSLHYLDTCGLQFNRFICTPFSDNNICMPKLKAYRHLTFPFLVSQWSLYKDVLLIFIQYTYN